MKTDFRNLLDGIRQRPGMYFTAPVSVEVVAAYVQGYDAGCDGQQLSGFQGWLAEQLGQGQNLTWSALAKKLAFRRAEAMGHQESDLERLAVGQFLQLVLEYLDARNHAEPKIEPIKRRTLARGR
jgi:hypothetical protein